jgi:hypothetical protein
LGALCLGFYIQRNSSRIEKKCSILNVMDGSEKGILWQSAPEENTGNSKSEYGASTDSE